MEEEEGEEEGSSPPLPLPHPAAAGQQLPHWSSAESGSGSVLFLTSTVQEVLKSESGRKSSQELYTSHGFQSLNLNKVRKPFPVMTSRGRRRWRFDGEFNTFNDFKLLEEFR